MSTGCAALADNDPLQSLQWSNRVILLFAPAGDSAGLATTRRAIEASRCESDDRDLTYVEVVGDRDVTRDGEPFALQPATLRARYGVSSGDAVAILVGKDGGEKERTALPLSLDSIFEQVDAMPMRRREMRSRPDSCR